MNTIFRIARKEFSVFFCSPVAFIFFGAFLAVTLFVFFWAETFFATNIAEIRPLFEWMPILLIFLTSAVTMRMWAEERRAGTLEFLLTSPVRPLALVLGKFLACLALLVVSLGLTLPLPITVSMMGPLDWGPVFGGYLAAIFLAAAYIAIGLFVSVKAETQIVSLILSTLVCSLFYLIGSDTLSAFFGNTGSEILKMLGSGSRFDAITRGVIDLRDLYYYLAIMGIFLSLNVYGLEKFRWAGNTTNTHHRLWRLLSGLLIANFLAVNFWLSPVGTLRTDMTKGNIYSISEATRSYLGQLKEPLLIRGYFSPQTHPLLAPLVPRIRDLMQEYSVAGGAKVRVEFVDPLENPELEQEAGQKYGIRPIPFQTTSKYQASVTNSYFDILIQYGDQFETLGFRDLIEVKVKSEQDIEVALRNPEYDITRAIKKILYSYQGGGDLLAAINTPVSFTGYFSPDEQLPKELVSIKKELTDILSELKGGRQDTLSYSFVDPDADNGKIAKKIETDFGFKPLSASLFDQRTFWFYMTLSSGDQMVEIPLPQDLSKDSLKRGVEAGLKRFASGFNKTVAFNSPPATPPMPQYGMPAQGKPFNIVKEMLSQEHTLQSSDLKDGQVPTEADILVVASPESVDDKQLFAMDQFLMKGGTIIIATSPYDIETNRNLSLKEHRSGIEEWLTYHGITIAKELVMDPQNSAFPVPVQRQMAGFSIQETRMVNYPFFVDIRQDGMNMESGLMSGLQQVTMNWPSPITIDGEMNKERRVLRLLESSKDSWTSTDSNVQPDFKRYGEKGFAVGKKAGEQLLGILVEGRFTSFFKDKPSPLLSVKEDGGDSETLEAPEGEETPTEPEDQKEPEKQVIAKMINHSPESARLIVYSSNSFLDDTVISIGSSVRQTNYLGPVQMIANAVDWSLEDRGLLEIRGRSHFSRPLVPMGKSMQMFWEYLNYALALGGLVIVWLIKRYFDKRTGARHQRLLAESIGRA